MMLHDEVDMVLLHRGILKRVMKQTLIGIMNLLASLND